MLKRLFFAHLLLLCFCTVNAQFKPLKIGYTNVEYLIQLMPDLKIVEKDYATYRLQLENKLKEQLTAYENKVKDYQSKIATMNETTKKQKEEELLKEQQELLKAENQMEEELVKKNQELMQPLYEKLDKVIKEVAKENDYTYIFNTDAGSGTSPILLYGPEEFNITELVKKKLGIIK
ncbi:MAG: OmpH family outer membrane protein [Bacteroidia bacterium]|nr:OmpH family outer membrane protein [Bacteroidia bacterium]